MAADIFSLLSSAEVDSGPSSVFADTKSLAPFDVATAKSLFAARADGPNRYFPCRCADESINPNLEPRPRRNARELDVLKLFPAPLSHQVITYRPFEGKQYYVDPTRYGTISWPS
ncbi:unnamed protein product, partial [Iphiclides podalirius]